MKRKNKTKKIKIISCILIIIFIFLISNVHAIEAEQNNEKQFSLKTINEIKQSMRDKNNKTLFVLTKEDDFEDLSERISESLKSQEDSKLKKGYNSLIKKYKYIIEADTVEVSFSKPGNNYNRDDENDLEEEDEKSYTEILKN